MFSINGIKIIGSVLRVILEENANLILPAVERGEFLVKSDAGS